MIDSHVLRTIDGVVHGFGARGDDLAAQFGDYWPRRAIQHERHGVRIVTVTAPGQDCGEADGMLTDRPGILLAIATADCAPVLLARKDGAAVAALHVGWRGALAGIVPQFGALLTQRGERPGDWTAAIGPTAGPCCYEVSTDIIDQLQARYAIDAALLSPRPRYLDLARLVRWQLEVAGVGAVGVASMCTICHCVPSHAGLAFHSYRRDRATRVPGVDVQWSAIAMAPSHGA
jgi:YfiH family protein